MMSVRVHLRSDLLCHLCCLIVGKLGICRGCCCGVEGTVSHHSLHWLPLGAGLLPSYKRPSAVPCV